MRNGAEKLRKRLRGWQKIPRERHLIAEKHNLTDGEFRLLELYRDLTDWDDRHIDTYKTFFATDADIAELLNCNPSTISRRRGSLLSKSLIKVTKDKRYEIVDDSESNTYSEAIKVFGENARKKEQDAEKHNPIALEHEECAPTQENRGQSTELPLVSFKGDFVSLVPCDRYLELEKSGRFGAMTADDMEFIEPSNPEWELVRNRILGTC